ncbi:MAG: helix-turn-helix transcriptional regulator [Oscillospiraceae bacterium]|jgi:transcriptional regulator with XRE-family HTH domain|nr:helix-turn-helix transcriptional regulator [Oscillospiraceae bacterium]
MFDQQKFSTRLRKLRKDANISQKILADTIGVCTNQISQMEKGAKTTSLAKLCLLCDYFNVSADYLLGRTDTP